MGWMEWIINAINEACAYLNIDDRILLLQNPMAVGAAKKLQAKSIVFDAIDNWLYVNFYCTTPDYLWGGSRLNDELCEQLRFIDMANRFSTSVHNFR